MIQKEVLHGGRKGKIFITSGLLIFIIAAYIMISARKLWFPEGISDV